MSNDFDKICNSIPNEDLRYQVDKILKDSIRDLYELKRLQKKAVLKSDIKREEDKAKEIAIGKYPELYDYFICMEENNVIDVVDKASKEVSEIKNKLYRNYRKNQKR